MVSGADASYFSINGQPPQSIPAGSSVTFDVVISANSGSPYGATSRFGTIGIASNDPDLANLSFDVTGTDQYS